MQVLLPALRIFAALEVALLAGLALFLEELLVFVRCLFQTAQLHLATRQLLRGFGWRERWREWLVLDAKHYNHIDAAMMAIFLLMREFMIVYPNNKKKGKT